MIYTVFAAAPGAIQPWQVELLEYSWRRVRQPGELVRLTPAAREQALPSHRTARVVRTTSWNPHPYTGDPYGGYELASSCMEWLFREPIDGTILLLDPHSVFSKPVSDETVPGQVLATAWNEMPTGDGPFGLAKPLQCLESYCVNRQLPLAPVRLPLLIHSTDLRKIAARWAELTAIIRCEARDAGGKLGDADRIAYAVASAEYRIQHAHAELGCGTDAEASDAALINYSRRVESAGGDVAWGADTYQPWSTVHPEKARSGPGRDFLALLQELASREQSGTTLASQKPIRRGGVREARILDDMQIEIPGCKDSITLNSSAAAIWDLCDGNRNLGDIVSELERRFDAPKEVLRDAVQSTATELVAAGALLLEEAR